MTKITVVYPVTFDVETFLKSSEAPQTRKLFEKIQKNEASDEEISDFKGVLKLFADTLLISSSVKSIIKSCDLEKLVD